MVAVVVVVGGVCALLLSTLHVSPMHWFVFSFRYVGATPCAALEEQGTIVPPPLPAWRGPQPHTVDGGTPWTALGACTWREWWTQTAAATQGPRHPPRQPVDGHLRRQGRVAVVEMLPVGPRCLSRAGSRRRWRSTCSGHWGWVGLRVRCSRDPPPPPLPTHTLMASTTHATLTIRVTMDRFLMSSTR